MKTGVIILLGLCIASALMALIFMIIGARYLFGDWSKNKEYDRLAYSHGMKAFWFYVTAQGLLIVARIIKDFVL